MMTAFAEDANTDNTAEYLIICGMVTAALQRDFPLAAELATESGLDSSALLGKAVGMLALALEELDRDDPHRLVRAWARRTVERSG